MKRRTFVKAGLIGAIAEPALRAHEDAATHILTLSFDDGFRKSFYKIAELYEAHGLSACFNVIASGHLPSFKAVDQWILPELMGNFDDWNALQERGHEIMPHSWQHLNLARQPLDEAKALIDQCLDYFAEHLQGFDATRSIFNFPFNASTPDLEQFTLTRVRALRSGGRSALNPIPTGKEPLRLQCRSQGPDNIDHWIQAQVDTFLASDGGWLILNAHGLDEEGWGPISTTYLDTLLKQLVKVKYVSVRPPSEVLP